MSDQDNLRLMVQQKISGWIAKNDLLPFSKYMFNTKSVDGVHYTFKLPYQPIGDVLVILMNGDILNASIDGYDVSFKAVRNQYGEIYYRFQPS